MEKPGWLKIYPSARTDFSVIGDVLRKRGLSTVCEEAHCPNMAECWHKESTVTFMLMGETCTRGCRFCAVKTARKGRPLDPHEPKNIAQAIAEMKLDYAVITSVDRDDLTDQGAGHFAACITAIRHTHPKTFIEVLIPDFSGKKELLKTIVDAGPDVIAHNIETVKSLQHRVRDGRASYEQSLGVLKTVKELDKTIFTKSSLMVGFGETTGEIEQAMQDLRQVDCDILTIGQYLQPSVRHQRVVSYIHPDQFKQWELLSLSKGFLFVASGPLVRSSYRAGAFFIKHLLSGKTNAKEVVASQAT